jgi:hypothetical protein
VGFEMKKVLAISAILIIIALLAVLLIGYDALQTKENSEAYVGVAYCGNSVAEGKQLIDKVKGYTNLFVLQSGELQRNLAYVDELGDYAVSSGLYFLPYFGNFIETTFSAWLETAKQKWGTRFLGVYYSDEPGGKMLDDNVKFTDAATGDSITKTKYGDIVVKKPNNVVIHYEINGLIHLSEPTDNSESTTAYSTFYPNGTKTGEFTDQPSFTTYEELMNVKPFKDNDETAERFVTRDQNKIEYLTNNSIKVFTSDYALYWWDYLSGYDVVLAHIGWNITLAQQIAQVRGAAKLQSKDWGIVITWKYNTPPYLDTGSEIRNQMQTAYEAGAKYLVLFNYYEDNGNPDGTMQEEHFQALENFWNNVIKNPHITPGSTKADTVLILPKNHGCGMRWREDNIWGIFKADEQAQQLWDLKQSTLQNHALKTDIVYEDPAYPLTEEYQNTYHWTQNEGR